MLVPRCAAAVCFFSLPGSEHGGNRLRDTHAQRRQGHRLCASDRQAQLACRANPRHFPGRPGAADPARADHRLATFTTAFLYHQTRRHRHGSFDKSFHYSEPWRPQLSTTNHRPLTSFDRYALGNSRIMAGAVGTVRLSDRNSFKISVRA